MEKASKKILCVDDEADARELLEFLLKRTGHEITTAETYADGLRLAQEHDFDLYILDNKLPDGNGIDLCRSIRKFDADTPVVILTAMMKPAYRDMAMTAGAQAFLLKPNNMDDVTFTIERLLRGR